MNLVNNRIVEYIYSNKLKHELLNYKSINKF